MSDYKRDLKRIQDQRRQAARERRQDDYRQDQGFQNLYNQEVGA